uniref:UdgX family uracil-DNA binding protein n=1 Tax=Paracoccus sp. N5 TaxID=1101189 RepID=UPI000684D8EC
GAGRGPPRRLASARIEPGAVTWAEAGTAPDLFGAEPLPPPGGHPVRATPDFLALCRQVGFHGDPQRWSLLYTALLRTQEQRDLLADPTDPLVIRLQALARSVRRDIHKMHAFLRFHELPATGPRRRFAAWFEPEHPILQAAAPFFARRFADMDWRIVTPEGVAHFDGALRFSEPVPRPDLPPDASHALWQTYFANIFNPARIKTRAMRSEMPLKYWKNLPETRLVPRMLADAPRRVAAMAAAGASEAPGFAAKVIARLRLPTDEAAPATLEQARAQAAACRRCDLCHAATRTVWGEGDPDAALMIVGEAPGDHEDLRGRPFVGPAGQLLRAVLAEVGLDPDRAWLTNAVKHFKFAPQGKRRLHRNPSAAEIDHCRWWLNQERRLVAPRLTVALGASAALALTGRKAPLTARRGSVEPALDGGPVLLTWHPSLILRLPAAEARTARSDFAADFARAAAMLGAQARSRSLGSRDQ